MKAFSWLSGPLDVLLATGCSAIGSLFGYFVFLVINTVVTWQMPRHNDFSAKIIIFVASVGLIGGALSSPILRMLIGPIHSRTKWMSCWVVTWAIAGPLIVILLIGWAMAGRPY